MDTKVWCLHDRHDEPCPDADTCLACVEECGAGEGADTSVQFLGTEAEAIEEMTRRQRGEVPRFEKHS